LEWVQVDVPLARERYRFRIFSVVDCLKLLEVGHELFLEAVEASQELQTLNSFEHLPPGQTVYECRRFRNGNFIHEAHEQLLEVIPIHLFFEYFQLHH